MAGTSGSLPFTAEQVDRVVTAATQAPSILNAQPWRFVVDSDGFRVHVDLAAGPTLLDPSGREVAMSVGAAVTNLRLALALEGWTTTVEITEDDEDPWPVTVVRPAGRAAPDAWERALAQAVPVRRTSRLPFQDRDVDGPLLTRLEEAAEHGGAHLEPLAGLHREDVVHLVHEADRVQRDDAALVQQALAWTVNRDRTGASAGAARGAGVGVPAASLGPLPDDPSAVVRDLAFGRPVAERPHATFEPHPRLAVLMTMSDRPVDWVRGGMALERVLLTATALGLSTGLLSQVPEVADLRPFLRDPMSPWRYALIVLRLGYGPVPQATPRRPLSDVLTVLAPLASRS
jgi:nitroreductase